MSDLISRNALINVLKERATNESIAGYMTAYDVTNSIIDEVEEQPTAYDIDKVVQELQKIEEHCIAAYDWQGQSAIDDAIEIVKQHEAKQHKGGWIPVSDRLPENNKVVLCWVVSKTIASGETFIIGSCDRGFWFLQTYEIGHNHFPVKDYEVVAWQPLPQPYTKGE